MPPIDTTNLEASSLLPQVALKTKRRRCACVQANARRRQVVVKAARSPNENFQALERSRREINPRQTQCE